jgi:hypothetical protein
MTIRGYLRIATAFANLRPSPSGCSKAEYHAAEQAWQQCVFGIIAVLKETDPSFDRRGFLIACGVEID